MRLVGLGGGADHIYYMYIYIYMDVSENSGTPKSSILTGFSIINYPFGVPLLLETPIQISKSHGSRHVNLIQAEGALGTDASPAPGDAYDADGSVP